MKCQKIISNIWCDKVIDMKSIFRGKRRIVRFIFFFQISTKIIRDSHEIDKDKNECQTHTHDM